MKKLIVLAVFFATPALSQDLTHPLEMGLPDISYTRPDPAEYQLALENGLIAYVAEADQKASFRRGFLRLGMGEPIAVPMNMFAEPPDHVDGMNKRERYLERRMPHIQTKSRTPI
jgi:hypothetical protein